MDNLTPITREEMLMNDEPLTPITREEKILAGEDLNPVTRREYFLKKYRHAGGDVMVEGLEVTANGTYTAPEDKAYSPVEVAVPLPDNAYLLKEASGSLVSFSDGADLPMPSFICNIDAVQDLHGYDAPWPAGGGKNITPPLDQVKSDSGLTVTPQSDGSVIINGTYTGETGWYVITKTFTVYANKTYSVSIGDIASGLINAYGLNGYGQAHTITPTADFNTNVRLNINNGTVFNNVRLYPQTELGEQATSYAPYSNICPILGHTGVDAWVRGKNLYNNEVGNLSVNGVTFTKNADGSITTSGTSTSNAYYNMSNVVFPKGTYIANGCPSGGADNKYKISVYNNSTSVTIGTGDTGEGTQFEVDGESEYRLFIRIANNQDMNGFTFYPMIRLATIEDATYEPYNPNSQTIQVSWQTEAGEVFGGYVDLASGVLTVTHKEITYDGVTSGKMFTNKGGGSDNNYYMSCYDGYLFDGETDYNWVNNNAMRNRGLINSHYGYAETSTSIGFRAYIGNNGTALQPRLQFGAYSDITTIELANQWLAEQYTNGTPWQVKYPLATPQTYQLTPTQIKSLLENNNAWCSTGDVDIDYFAKEVTG